MLKMIAAGAAMFVAMISAADAAVITKRYEVTSAFTAGTPATVVTSFDVTFDPTVTANVSNIGVSNFTSTAGSFKDVFADYRYTPFKDQSAQGFANVAESWMLVVYENSGGADVDLSVNDFVIYMDINKTGEPIAGGFSMYATQSAGVRAITPTFREIMPSAAAVPEPATWAMMLLGFGMVAGAARYRRRRTTLRYA